MTRIAIAAFIAVMFATPDSPSPLRGPPLICYPIDIGSAKSLPWGRGPVALDETVSRENVARDTLRILEESDDALVHMETLRRAYMYLQAGPSGGMSGPDTATSNVRRMGDDLKDAVLVASIRRSIPRPAADSADPRREALAWFDLGYFLAIKQNGMHGREILRDLSCHPILEKAAGIAPRDAALQFGVAFAQIHNRVDDRWQPDHPQTTYWQDAGKLHLEAAMDLTTDKGSLLAKNICALLASDGPFGPPTTFEDIRKRIAPESRPK